MKTQAPCTDMQATRVYLQLQERVATQDDVWPRGFDIQRSPHYRGAAAWPSKFEVRAIDASDGKAAGDAAEDTSRVTDGSDTTADAPHVVDTVECLWLQRYVDPNYSRTGRNPRRLPARGEPRRRPARRHDPVSVSPLRLRRGSTRRLGSALPRHWRGRCANALRGGLFQLGL